MADDILKKLKDFANSDEAKNVAGAGADLIEDLFKEKDAGSADHLLTGDKYTDASIRRGKAVEQAIKDKWNVDLEDALDFIYMLVEAGTKLSGLIS